MGTVYKAVDETLDRTVAIKVLNADLLDQDSVERFRREAVTLARLNHPRIGAIHELTRDGHDLPMVMEFISGETVEHLLERSAPFAVPEAVRLCAQVLEGLQYAHGAGVIHRDLKPANVIVMPSGDVKIMDFGIARVQGSEHLTSVGFMVGTPAYMSPEQVRGEEVDPRMDLYSMAVVLYRLLTHRLPFQGNTAIAMIQSQLNNSPTPPREFRADLPDWIVAALSRGMAKAPMDRFHRGALEGGLTGRMAISAILGPAAAETMPPTMTPRSMAIPVAAASTGDAPMPAPSAVLAQPMPATALVASGTGIAAAPSAPAMPQPPPLPASTVTLQAPHLATAGILIGILVAGIAVLAFVALRRPATTAPPPAQGAIAAPVPAASDTVASTPNDAAPGAAVSTPILAPAAPSPVTPAAPPRPVAAAPTTAPAASVAAPTAVGGRSSAQSAPDTPARGRASAAPAVVAATPGAPAAADAPAEHFADVRTLVVDGSRGREVDAMLSLEPGSLVVRARTDGTVMRTLSYRAVTAATYARARRPRGQSIPGALDVPENFGGSGVLGGSRHWLTLQTAGEFLVIRLEDRNVVRILTAVEARTGLTVERKQD